MCIRFIASRLALVCATTVVLAACGSGGHPPPPPPPPATRPYLLEFVNLEVGGLESPDFGWTPTDDDIRRRIASIAPYTRGVKIFGSAHGYQNAARIAREFGLKVIQIAWIGRDLAESEKELDALIAAALAGFIDIAVVGSEVTLRADVDVPTLVAYIARVRAALAGSGVPVTTAEVHGILASRPELIAASDIVFCHAYALWETIAIEHAMTAIDSWYRELRGLAGGKQVFLSEVGWATSGQTIGSAVPSPTNAGRHLREFLAWARANDVSYAWFSSHDAPWKRLNEGELGTHWGLIDWDTGTLKPEFAAVLDGGQNPDALSESIPGGAGLPTIALTNVPALGSEGDLVGSALHIAPSRCQVVVYIRVDGAYWIKPYADRSSTDVGADGTWVTNVTTGGADASASEIVAFLLPSGYSPPILLGAPSLPSALAGSALDAVTIAR